MFREEDGAGIGRPPEDGLTFVVPGKDAVPVRFEQPLRLEIAADGKSPSGVACSTAGKLRSRGFRLNRTMAERCSSSLVRCSGGQQGLEHRIGVKDGFQ